MRNEGTSDCDDLFATTLSSTIGKEIGRPFRFDCQDMMSGIYISPGIFVFGDRNDNESAVFFIDVKRQQLKGAVYPTPPNWGTAYANGKIYQAQSGGIMVIDAEHPRLVKMLEIKATILEVMRASDKKIYALSNTGGNIEYPPEGSVYVIDAVADEVSKVLKVGADPYSIWKKNGKIYVRNEALDDPVR
jgi:hypothetical protein